MYSLSFAASARGGGVKAPRGQMWPEPCFPRVAGPSFDLFLHSFEGKAPPSSCIDLYTAQQQSNLLLSRSARRGTSGLRRELSRDWEQEELHQQQHLQQPAVSCKAGREAQGHRALVLSPICLKTRQTELVLS
jgi:hypothetical protein